MYSGRSDGYNLISGEASEAYADCCPRLVYEGRNDSLQPNKTLQHDVGCIYASSALICYESAVDSQAVNTSWEQVHLLGSSAYAQHIAKKCPETSTRFLGQRQ